jgi:hypothetical protein
MGGSKPWFPSSPDLTPIVFFLRDKIRNETIRRNLGVPPLRIKIEESQLRWGRHVLRMGGDRIVRKVFEAKAQGGRPVGRPRQTWEEQVI